jgi:hypothetical protein
MAKYVLTYVGGSEPKPEDAGGVMTAWMNWMGSLGSSLVDGGAPFGASTAIGGTVTSGVTGYSILEASDLTAATKLAEGCPHLAAGGTVEIHETIDVTAMG